MENTKASIIPMNGWIMAELDDAQQLDDEAVDETHDPESPFHPDNAAGLALIVHMRNYDVLMAILNKIDPMAADMVYEAHKKGQIITDLPSYLPEPEPVQNNHNHLSTVVKPFGECPECDKSYRKNIDY